MFGLLPSPAGGMGIIVLWCVGISVFGGVCCL